METSNKLTYLNLARFLVMFNVLQENVKLTQLRWAQMELLAPMDPLQLLQLKLQDF